MNPTVLRLLPAVFLLSLASGSARAGSEAALAPALEGEFALQGGDYALASNLYLKAANLASDPALAKRATEIALLTHQDATAERALQRWRELDHASADNAGAGVVLALRRGAREQANVALLAMLAGGANGWKNAIRSLAAAGDTSTATLVAGDLLDRGRWPPDIEAWLAFGGLAQRLGDAALTRRVVAEVVRRFPQDPRAWLLESAQLREQDDAIGARKAIQHALLLAGNDAGWRNAAADELAQHAPAEAAAALALGTQSQVTYASRAAFLARVDDRAGLQALYAEIQAHSAQPNAERRLLLGKLAEYLKHDDLALTWYRSVPRGDSHSEAISRSSAVLDRQGNTEQAMALLHAEQQDQNESEDAQRASYRLEAQLLADRKHYDAALSVYARGLGAFDADPDLLYGRALLLEQMDRVAESEADLRGILEIDPDNAEVLNALGYTLADRTKRYSEAQRYIEHALILQPDTPAFLDSLGWVQHRLGHDAEAVRNLRRAFALQKDAEIAAHLGEVLWLDGDHDGARRVWQQGQALDKDNRALQHVIDTYKP